MAWVAPRAVFIVLLLLVGSSSSAQTGQGRLTGSVTDIQRAVLPGVTVVAVSPALIGQQVAITQADGRYLFPALPSGVYSLTFTLASFQTFLREGLQLSLATTITVDAQLSLAAVQQHVVVSAASPVVDVATTKVGLSVKGEALVGAELHRRLGRARRITRNPHAGVRRRRQPQEPAVRIRGVRHSESIEGHLRRH